MSTEQSKSATQNTQEQHPYPPPPAAYQPFNGAAFPAPGAYPPPYFASYAPAPDPNHTEGAQTAAPPGAYMMFPAPPPPGMVYAAYPTPPQVAVAQSGAAAPAQPKPKRKQVKMACTNCAAACKRCDEHRPCERCVKYGIEDSCVDGQRKERKKGIKRGPYKRKNKNQPETPGFTSEGEQQWAAAQPPTTTATTTAAMQAVAAHQFSTGEFYPLFYPTPAFLPHPHDAQSGQDGTPHTNGQPPLMQYYIHPGGYPPFAPYPIYASQGAHPALAAHPQHALQPIPQPLPPPPQPQPQSQSQPQPQPTTTQATVNKAEASGKKQPAAGEALNGGEVNGAGADANNVTGGQENGASQNGAPASNEGGETKKRQRSSTKANGDVRPKKSKTTNVKSTNDEVVVNHKEGD